MTDKVVVLSTCGSEDEAARIARLLVEERLAACVAVTTRVRSYYHWQGNLEESEEWALTIKTSRALCSALMDRLKAVHSYQVPEILALAVVDGDPDYLDWMQRELKQE
jgi:periplasmic divalent cation tolerance protein